MSEPLVPEVVDRIEIFSRWIGFAHPSCRVAKLTIAQQAERLIRTQAISKPASSEVPRNTVARFLAALTRPPIAALDPARFNVPEAVIQSHYGSVWTDDYPSLLVHVFLNGGGRIDIRSEAQYSYMLPFRVTTGQGSVETFDPELSRAISELLPDGFLGKERLSGIHGLLQYTARLHEERSTHENGNAESEPHSGSAESIDSAKTGDLERTIVSISLDEETRQQKAEAKRRGRFSKRLLRRISMDDLRDLIARGADVNIADDVGQTALMHAAFPPFNPSRFRLLVEAGAHVDARRGGATGLHIACVGGEAQAASEWVRAGADVHATTAEGETPLMLGAKWSKIVEMLLGRGADVNAIDPEGHSALVYAILGQSCVNAKQHVHALQMLLAAGADVQATDLQGNTPLDHAERVFERVLLEEEVRRAFNEGARPSPGRDWEDPRMAEVVSRLIRDSDWNDRRIAEEVVRLIRQAQADVNK